MPDVSYEIAQDALTVDIVSETPFTAQSNGVHTAFVQMVDALEKVGVRAVPNAKDRCDIVHIHTVGPYSLLKLLANKRRSVVSAHLVPDSFVGSLALAKLWKPLAKMYLSFFYSLPKAVVAVSPSVRDELKEMGVKKDIFYIPNGVDLDKFRRCEQTRDRLRARLGIAEDAFVVISVGQVQPRKGVQTFIDTARELPDVTFLWIGGTPFEWLSADYDGMQKLMKDTPRNLRFIGEVPLDDMPAYYNAADVLFFPSVQETFGLVVVEAGAAQLPLLMSRLSTYEALFGKGYIPGTRETFKDYVLQLKNDHKFYEEYAQRAFEIATRYDDVKQAEELVRVYEGILEEASQKAAHKAALKATQKAAQKSIRTRRV